jgi:hypothetical protein
MSYAQIKASVVQTLCEASISNIQENRKKQRLTLKAMYSKMSRLEQFLNKYKLKEELYGADIYAWGDYHTAERLLKLAKAAQVNNPEATITVSAKDGEAIF